MSTLIDAAFAKAKSTCLGRLRGKLAVVPKMAAVYTAAVAPTLPLAVTRPYNTKASSADAVHKSKPSSVKALDLNASLPITTAPAHEHLGLCNQLLALLPSTVCESFLQGIAALHELTETQASSCRPSCLPSCPWHLCQSLKGPLLLCLTWLLDCCKLLREARKQKLLQRQCSGVSKKCGAFGVLANGQIFPCVLV